MASLTAIAGVIYLWRLRDAPFALTRNEVFVGLLGHSLATRGRDLEGWTQPLFMFSRVNGTWWPPILPYAMAGVLRVLPLSEATIRTPMAIAAILNTVLMFFAGRLLFARRTTAWACALLVAMAPLQVIDNRYADDVALPSTFAIAWVLASFIYLRGGRVAALGATGLMLGVGAYSYVGATPLMPLYLALTAVVLALRRESPPRYLVLVAAFVLPIAMGVPWLLRHPEVLRTTFLHYEDSSQFGVLDAAASVKTLVSIQRAGQIWTLYRRFWSTRAMFVSGTPWLIHSTGRAGVFLLPIAGLMLLGIVRSAGRALADPRLLLVLGAFVLAPLPAGLVDFNDHLSVNATWRAIEIVPMGALLVGVGAEWLLHLTGGRQLIAVVLALIVPLLIIAAFGPAIPQTRLLVESLVVPVAAAVAILGLRKPFPTPFLGGMVLAGVALATVVQFRGFYADYLGKYQDRLAADMDGDMRSVLESVIDHAPAAEAAQRRSTPVVYLGFRLGAGDFGFNYWQFYLRKHHREDLLARTINDSDGSLLTVDRLCHLPRESLVATRIRVDKAADALVDRMAVSGVLRAEGVVGGDPVYRLLRTTGSCAGR